MKALTQHAKRVLWISAAFVCLVIGLLTVWTPLPTGIPLIAIGVVLLATVSATARRYVKDARRRWGLVDRGLVMVEARTGRSVATMLKRTRPLQRKLNAKAALDAAMRTRRNRAKTP